jgi:hypothetical protein
LGQGRLKLTRCINDSCTIHSSFDPIICHLTVSLLAKLFEFYLEFLKNIMLLFVVLSLLSCRTHPFFPPIFSDDTVDRSLVFMDGIDPTPKSNRSIKTGLTFVLCICFFWNSWKYDVITKNYYIYIHIMKYSHVLFLGKCVHVLNYRNVL